MKASSTPLADLGLGSEALRALEPFSCGTLKDLLRIQPWQVPAEIGVEIATALDAAGVYNLSWWARLRPVASYLAPPDRRVPRTMLWFEPDPSASSTARLGGHPSAWGGPWPSCTGCRAPLRFVLQLEDPALQLFFCSEPSCSAPRYHAEIRDRLGPELAEGTQPPYPRFAVRLHPGWDDALASDRSAFDQHEAAYWNAVALGDVSKIGGVPTPPRMPKVEACPACGGERRYFAQLAPGSIPNLAPSGQGRCVLFLCEERHSAAAAWID